MPAQHKNKKRQLLFEKGEFSFNKIIIFALLTILIGFIFSLVISFVKIYLHKAPFFRQNPAVIKNTAEVPTVTPRPLATGRQIYLVQTKGIGPTITDLILDPIDPAPNQLQFVSIKIISSSPVKYVNYHLKTDNKTTQYTLNLSEGTDRNGVWIGTFIVDDTYLSTYMATIEAENNAGLTKVEPVFR